MGIQIEFNPDLALRNISEFREGRRKRGECIPEDLAKDRAFSFLKEGQRNFFLEGEVPLLETKGNSELSRPLASIIILEATHLIVNGRPYTKGRYKVVEVFDPQDPKIRFNGFAKVD